jgi:tetratricopeptide (TPR) repeat protein
MHTPPIWSATGLLDYFQEVDATADRRFSFILGAGASFQSGIPVAGQLVDAWLRELHTREDLQRTAITDWASEHTLGIPGFAFARAVEWYPQVFARRFARRPDEGYAYLERIMHGKDPSFGYSVLAQLLAQTRHRVVITTNFDNLVADALAIYTDQLPLVCGHESLAGFVRANPRRPLVVKIHRDLLLAPKNLSEEIAALSADFAGVLREILRSTTPIVLGYGGNDGSLMGFLRDALEPGDIPGGIYWCYLERGGPPGPAVQEVVARHPGALVPIAGFDEFMAELSHRRGLPRMDQTIERRARDRAQRYRESFEALQQRILRPPPPALDDEPAAPPPPPTRGPTPAPRPVLSDSQRSVPRPPAVERSRPTIDGDGAPDAVPPALAGRTTAEPTPAGSSSIVLRTPKFDAPTPAELDAPAEPSASIAAPAEPQPAPALEQAVRALGAEPEDGDWWAHKLAADREPAAPRRIERYRAALARFPDQPELHRGLARDLAVAGSHDEALIHYQAALAVDPKDPLVHAECAVLFVLLRLMPTAQFHAQAAWRFAASAADGTAAVVALICGVIARLEQHDDTKFLRVLKHLVPTTTVQTIPLAPALLAMLGNLSRPDFRLYSRLVACLTGQAAPSRLTISERWNELTPLVRRGEPD